MFPPKLPFQNIANGVDGELITWDANGVVSAVAVGTSGQVLTSNGAGAAPTMQAAGGGGGGAWSVKESGTLSADSSLDITDLTKTTKVILSLTGSVDTASVWARTSTDNGVSFDDGASDYSYSYDSIAHTTSPTPGPTGDDASAQYLLGPVISSTATRPTSLEFIIFDPAAAKQTNMQCAGNSRGNSSRQGTGTRLQSSGAVDAISFLTAASGTLTGTYVVLELN